MKSADFSSTLGLLHLSKSSPSVFPLLTSSQFASHLFTVLMPADLNLLAERL